MSVRVRFAPSPTGPLHIGGLRTALFNYLFARKHNGKFLLRIEDTDQGRFVPYAEEYIIETFRWCGIDIDEGQSVGGPHAPYRQSERKDVYNDFAKKLINNGWGYYAFDTPEELELLRKEHELQGRTFTYDASTRESLKNSLTISKEETQQLIDNSVPYVIRFKNPVNREIVMEDIIRGTVKVNTSTLDDKVLFKSDGLPTYHLANVVDDHLMEITHVIRGEEWLPSMPLHVMLYEALGWTETMPQFAHLPLILKPEGNGKLSKRDGDKMGFPVFPLLWKNSDDTIYRGYREDGYLPEAVINLLALLGWNPGTEQELFTMQELCESFDLSRVSKSGARFDPEKAKWFNHQHLQHKDSKYLALELIRELKEKKITVDFNYTVRVVDLIKERLNFLKDLWTNAHFFFINPTQFEEKAVKKRWKSELIPHLQNIANIIEDTNFSKSGELKNKISTYIESNTLGFGVIANAIRLAIVGDLLGPDLFVICETIGKEICINRIKYAIQNIDTEQ